MAKSTKTNPVGVRFDMNLLDHLRVKKLAATPQQAINFLTDFFWDNTKLDSGDVSDAFPAQEIKDFPDDQAKKTISETATHESPLAKAVRLNEEKIKRMKENKFKKIT